MASVNQKEKDFHGQNVDNFVLIDGFRSFAAVRDGFLIFNDKFTVPIMQRKFSYGFFRRKALLKIILRRLLKNRR